MALEDILTISNVCVNVNVIKRTNAKRHANAPFSLKIMININKYKDLCMLFALDKNLFAIILNPFIRIMWRTTIKRHIVFAPFAIYKGWILENKNQVSICIILSMLSYPWISLPLYLGSFLYNSYLYFAVLFWIQIATYKIICTVAMKYYGIKSISSSWLHSVNDDQFRRYLRSFDSVSHEQSQNNL